MAIVSVRVYAFETVRSSKRDLLDPLYHMYLRLCINRAGALV